MDTSIMKTFYFFESKIFEIEHKGFFVEYNNFHLLFYTLLFKNYIQNGQYNQKLISFCPYLFKAIKRKLERKRKYCENEKDIPILDFLLKRQSINQINTSGSPRYSISKDEFVELFNKHQNNDLIKFSLSPHSMYTCSADYLKKCSDLAIQLNIPLHIHFCEDENEVEGIKKNYNMYPAEALNDLGLFKNKLFICKVCFIKNNYSWFTTN